MCFQIIRNVLIQEAIIVSIPVDQLGNKLVLILIKGMKEIKIDVVKAKDIEAIETLLEKNSINMKNNKPNKAAIQFKINPIATKGCNPFTTFKMKIQWF